MQEAIVLRGYINSFFYPDLCKNVEKDFKTLERLNRQRKITAGALVTAIVLTIIAVYMDLHQAYTLEDTSAPEILQAGHERELYFDRNYYISNSVSIADFMRYQNDNISKPCFFKGCIVENIPEDRIYVCKCEGTWMIVDDQNKSLHAQALIGDSVSVYGVYDGVGTISLIDGSTRQVPIRHADKLIDNRILPEDTDSFLYGVVEAMNNNINGYGFGSEYISDAYAKLVVGVSYTFDYVNKTPSRLWSVDTSDSFAYDNATLVGKVDGYQIFIKTEWDENVVLPHELGIVTFADEEKYCVANKPVYVYGSFTYMELISTSLDVNTIILTFQIDSFEAYQ